MEKYFTGAKLEQNKRQNTDSQFYIAVKYFFHNKTFKKYILTQEPY